jgi:hypothetical protein
MPRSFARDMMTGTHNVLASMTNARPTQHGAFDPKMLCAKCDGIIGGYDDCANDICRKFPVEHVESDNIFEMRNVDGNKFATFALSVLWRASVSAREEFQEVKLGAFEEEAKKVIFGVIPLSAMPSYQLMIARYNKSKKLEVDKLYTCPARLETAGRNCRYFPLSGFRFVAKLDERPFEGIPREAIVNGNNRLFGGFIDFEGPSEHQAIKEMAKANVLRQKHGKK